MASELIEAPIIFADENRCVQCENELQNLQTEVVLCNEKVSQATKFYHETLVTNLKKDLNIRQLKQKIFENRFEQFHDTLSSPAINDLKTVAGLPEKDSTFVLKAMRCIYNQDLSRLKNKTCSGRAKDALSPEKKEIIEKLFKVRVESSEKDDTKAAARKSKLPIHVKNAITTISKGEEK